MMMMMTKTIIIIIMIIVMIMREPNSLRWFLAGPSNDMLGNRGCLILNQFLCFVEFHFYFILIILSFRKYPDFESEEKRFFVSLVIILPRDNITSS